MIYCLSGLGADERVFQYLALGEFACRHIQWLKPAPRESLAHYAGRLLEQIDLSDEVVLMGVSFGGIVAQEIAKLIPCRQVFLISSIQSQREFSWSLRFVRRFRLHRLVSGALLKRAGRFTADYFFSTETPAESALLQAIIRDTDPDFLQWAVGQLMHWKNGNPLPNVIHLHGTADRVFPLSFIRKATLIEGGGHFMVLNRAASISTIILSSLQSSIENSE